MPTLGVGANAPTKPASKSAQALENQFCRRESIDIDNASRRREGCIERGIEE
jgi:hypothetical protein